MKKFSKYLLLAALATVCLLDGELNPVEVQMLLLAKDARGYGYLTVTLSEGA